MKISELVAELEKLRRGYGDIEVVWSRTGTTRCHVYGLALCISFPPRPVCVEFYPIERVFPVSGCAA